MNLSDNEVIHNVEMHQCMWDRGGELALNAGQLRDFLNATWSF